MKRSFFRDSFCLLVLLLVLIGCYTVPETGRVGLTLIPWGQEVALGQSAFQEIKREKRISDNQEKNAMLQRVGGRLAVHASEHMPDAEWEFVLFEDDAINAFALPGGKVGVYTGLFTVAENEAQLAVVIGHELAHVTARHGNERLSRQLALTGVGLGVGLALQDQDPAVRNAVLIAYGLGTTIGLQLPHSRQSELEADRIGLIYMARAGYDPRAAIQFWERMNAAAAERPQPPEWLSTHPADARRIEELRAMMPEALAEYHETRASAGAGR